MKRCTICKETKPHEVFGKDKSRCKACNNARAKRRYEEKYKNDPEYMQRVRERSKKRYQTDEAARVAALKRAREYNLLGEFKERRKAYMQEWHKNNPKYSAKYGRYRRHHTKIPAWADLFEMQCIYKLCAAYRAIGLDMHVDHIVPLQGKTVCGLHTPDNLQIISATENLRKGASVWPDQP